MKTEETKQFKDLLRYSQRNRPQYIEFIPIPIYDEEEIEEPTVTKPNPLEPKTLTEFVGQEEAKEVLKIIVDSANKENRLIPNILLTGAYGHGKTTLAKLIAKRHRKKVQIVDGSVAGIMVKPDPNKIYIIDEAHNIPAQVADSFNILIDAGKLRIIGCTTNPGGLSAPFRSRFRQVYLEEYQPKDIAKIIERASKRLEISIEKAGINIIANRSKCNPRTALAMLDFIREISVMGKSDGEIKQDVVLEAMRKLGVDDIGLNSVDKKYLETLKSDRPVGLQYISSVLSIDIDTIQAEIEPYLLRIGLIERTSRGRTLSTPTYAPEALEKRLRQLLESEIG